METKPTSNRSYEDFEPVCKWRREESRDVIELHLPGFRTEHVRVQINHLGSMVISGERPLDGNRWKRFKKEVEPSIYCNVDAIRANFSQSILSVVMPKKIPQTHQKEQQETKPIPEFEHKKEKEKENEKEKKADNYTRDTAEEETETRAKEATEEDYSTDASAYEFVQDFGVGLTPETTREIVLKFMVVIVVILVIASYVTDLCKNFMAQAHSYFHN